MPNRQTEFGLEKTTCKAVEPVENLQNCKKVPAPVKGKKPNGKSRIQYVLMG